MRMSFDFGAQFAPVEIEIGGLDGALRIAYPHNRYVENAARKREREIPISHLGLAHIHFELELQALARQQPQMLDAGAGHDADFVAL